MGGQNSASIGRMRPYEGYQLVQGVSKFRLAKAHCWLAHAFEHANLSGQAAGGEWEWEPGHERPSALRYPRRVLDSVKAWTL